MLLRQERIALILLISVAVIVVSAHAVLTLMGKPAFAHPFTNQSAEGELVVIKGTVERATVLENGGHLTLLVRNTTLFIPAAAAGNLIIHKGDTVVAYGIVQTYGGKKEIVISAPEDIRITTIP
jgi:hypothetical protein